MISTIILDIKCHIATFDENIWYLMYRYDPEFRKYANTSEGKKNFIQCFTRVIYNGKHRFKDYNQKWMLFGRVHRGVDSSGEIQPAVYYTNGDVMYYYNGKLHRDNNKPAIWHANGTLSYYKNGILHRDDDEYGNSQPACITLENSKCYKNGRIHRNGDKPAWIENNGAVYFYYKDGLKHRDTDADGFDQPAVCSHSGTIKYYRNGLKHRDNDQPAIIKVNGRQKWYTNGVLIRRYP